MWRIEYNRLWELQVQRSTSGSSLETSVSEHRGRKAGSGEKEKKRKEMKEP